MNSTSWLATATALVFTCGEIPPVKAAGPADLKPSGSSAVERLVDAPQPKPYYAWPSTPPVGCPFQKSDTLVGVGFTGRHAEYTGADTWYPSWARMATCIHRGRMATSMALAPDRAVRTPQLAMRR